MNERIDVLAVMRNVSTVVLQGEARSCMRADMDKARAAVAELIKASHYAHREMEDHRVKMGECNECREAERMLCSALARVGGA